MTAAELNAPYTQPYTLPDEVSRIFVALDKAKAAIAALRKAGVSEADEDMITALQAYDRVIDVLMEVQE